MILGLVFLVAAVSKAYNPHDSMALWRLVMPSALSPHMISGVVVFERALGSALLSGLSPRSSAMASVVALAAFSAVLFRAKAMGADTTCGCLIVNDTLNMALLRNGILSILASAIYICAPSAQRRDRPFWRRYR